MFVIIGIIIVVSCSLYYRTLSGILSAEILSSAQSLEVLVTWKLHKSFTICVFLVIFRWSLYWQYCPRQ